MPRGFFAQTQPDYKEGTPNRKKTVTFIDLFAGIGGFRLGLERNGFGCVFSSEIDKYRQRVYAENFGETPEGDITKIPASKAPGHNVLTAGFPCQPFSISGRKRGFEDTRGTLFFEILRILQEKKPKTLFLENVGHLVHHNGGETLRIMLDRLKSLGYRVCWKVLNAKDFGVPQNRERIIIMGDLEREFDFTQIETSPADSMEPFLDKDNEFEYLREGEYTLIANPKRQKSGLIFVGHRNKAIRKRGIRPNTEHLSRVHKQPNRIYSAKGIHPTIPSQEPTGRFWILHDGKVRKITLDECYRFMGFPESFKRLGPVSEQYRQVGDSICVPMVEQIGKEIRRQLY